MSICSNGTMDLTDTEIDPSIQTIQQSLESIHTTLGTLLTLQKQVEKKVLSIKPVYTFFTIPRRLSRGRTASYSDILEETLEHPATTLSIGGSVINGVDCYTYLQTHILPPFTQAKK